MTKTYKKLPDNSISVLVGQSVTSASILCKYMKKPEYLYDILKNFAIKPRYVNEITDYLGIVGINSITIPMICFCDIPFSKVSKHTDNYGEYGIAFYKDKCYVNNVQPVTYVNPDSNYYSDLRDTLSRLLNSDKILEEEWRYLANFMLTQMVYSKPIVGDMIINNKKKRLLFKDECEWRYIPNLPDNMDLVLSPEKATPEGMEIYNKALATKKCENTWFKFTPDDICYLIVPSEAEALNLINFINTKMKRVDRTTRNKLISKIEITSKIVQDY